jgi:hypothetical protein
MLNRSTIPDTAGSISVTGQEGGVIGGACELVV